MQDHHVHLIKMSGHTLLLSVERTPRPIRGVSDNIFFTLSSILDGLSSSGGPIVGVTAPGNDNVITKASTTTMEKMARIVRSGDGRPDG